MRINRIVNLIKPNSIVIDVGSDHAKLAINLLKNKIASFVYNIEINELPLQNTIKNLKENQLLKKTKNILNDGLKELNIKRKIDYCTISGMGGKNIVEILSNKSKDLKIDNFILVPNNNAQLLRQFIKTNKYKVVYEEIILESNHYYELIHINKTKGLLIKNINDEYFGPFNLKHPTKIFNEYLKFKFNYLEKNKKVVINNKNKLTEYSILRKNIKKSKTNFN